MKLNKLVTPLRQTALKTFAAELADLCDKYQIDLVASPDSAETIEIVERTFSYPEGHEFSALFHGVDKRGAYNSSNPTGKHRRGLHICQYVEEGQV